jgi:uncharacterized membrane protein
MTNRIRDGLPASPLRLVLFAGLAAGVLGGAFASPAYAVNMPTARGSEARQTPAIYQVADDRGRGRGPARGREGPRGGDYHGGGWVGGPGYYSAPPVIVEPYGYYQQPAPLFDLSIPLVVIR